MQKHLRFLFKAPQVFPNVSVLVSLFDYFTAVFVDALFRHYSADAGCRIDVAVSSDDCSRVAYRVAAYLDVVAEHCSELLDAGLDLFRAVVNDYELLVGLDIGCDGSGSHVAVISEDGIAYIVVVRCLNVIEEDHVLELYGVSYNAVSSDKSRTSYECAVSYLSVRSDDAWSSEICARENLCSLVNPYVLADLIVFCRIKSLSELDDHVLDALQSFPRISELSHG